MEAALVTAEVYVMSKEGKKTSDKEFLTNLKAKSDVKLTITQLNRKATKKTIPHLNDTHK